MRTQRPILCAVSALAIATAEASDYFVDPSGANGAFTTVQSAINAVTAQTELNRANIFIAPGEYHEPVVVAQPFISLVGTGDSADAVRIVAARETSSVENCDWGQVLWIQPSATAFMARNLTVRNSSPNADTMLALAVQSSADRAVFDNVHVVGSRDTLLVDFMSRVYFRDSWITGDADFIFGDATAVFDRCTVVSTDVGYIGAPSTAATTAIGLVFLDSTLLATVDRLQTAGDGSTTQGRSVFLARPWQWWEPGRLPSATFIRTRMGSHIAAQGWDSWSIEDAEDGDPDSERDRHTRFAEFGTMDLSGQPLDDADGDGIPDLRASWADRLTAEQAANYTVDRIFGPAEFWNSSTQPDAPDTPYQNQGAPWNATGQLALLPTTFGAAPHPLNLSTRLRVGTGENVGIAGFIVRGNVPKSVVLRALGPSLRDAAVQDALANPTLALRDAKGTIAQNGDWRQSQQTEIAAVGLAPPRDLESAVVASLTTGSYTAVLAGEIGATGVGLAEIYDIDPNADANLTNISTRGLVGSGDDVMIAGFILGGAEGSAKVMIRGIGPSLSTSGVAQPLLDPALTLHDKEGALITSNDDWQQSQANEIQATGIAPSDAREAAIVATLPAGSYTAVLTGKNQSGVGLIEVYALHK